MKEEIIDLEDNKTWKVFPLPQGQKFIGCRWVYKVQYKAYGHTERYKESLAAKTYILPKDFFTPSKNDDC